MAFYRVLIPLSPTIDALRFLSLILKPFLFSMHDKCNRYLLIYVSVLSLRCYYLIIFPALVPFPNMTFFLVLNQGIDHVSVLIMN